MLKRDELINSLKQISLDSNPVINSALEIAQSAHKNQLRDNGSSYLEEHIYPIAISVLNRYKDDKEVVTLISSAIIHDVLEDSDYKESNMRERVGDKITDIVKNLTKSQEENASGLSEDIKMKMNGIYLDRVINSNRETIIIKLEDRLQNLSCITDKTHLLKPDKYKRYIIETESLFIPLTYKLKEAVNYKQLLQDEIERIKVLFS